MENVVVLPAPFGPMRPKTLPALMVSVRSSTAFFRPNVFVTPFTRMAASVLSVIEPISDVPLREDERAKPARTDDVRETHAEPLEHALVVRAHDPGVEVVRVEEAQRLDVAPFSEDESGEKQQEERRPRREQAEHGRPRE